MVLEGLFCFGPRRDSGLDRWQTDKQNTSVQRLQDSLEAACFTVQPRQPEKVAPRELLKPAIKPHIHPLGSQPQTNFLPGLRPRLRPMEGTSESPSFKPNRASLL